MSLKLKEERVEGGGPELHRSGHWCLVESEGCSQLENKEGGGKTGVWVTKQPMVLPSQARPHPGRREPQLHGEPTRCSEPSATPQQQENLATAEEVVRASRSRAAPTSAGGGWEDEGRW